MNPSNDPPRHPAEDQSTGVANDPTQEPIGTCEQCDTVIFLGEAKTESYAGLDGERVVLAFCEECAGEQ